MTERPTPDLGAPQHVRQLVLQPTPFCNIDCRYCYLGSRDDRRRMSLDTIRAACRLVFDSPYMGTSLDVVWHAGEPLVLPPSYYEDAFDAVAEEAPPTCRARHVMQTNGLRIDDAWCALFRDRRVNLGLSIDGPAWLHDRNRVTRSGRGTHARIMESVALLRRHEVPFSAIAVLTRESLDHPDEIYDFFAALGARSLGFNVEETEAANVSETLASTDLLAAYHGFMTRLLERSRDGSLRVREFDALRKALRGGGETRSTEAQPFDVVSVDVDGAIATFSPELLGVVLPGHGLFQFGRVSRATLRGLLLDERFQRAAAEVAQGVAACRETCGYFALCGGGAPANKVFENGSFATTATRHCATRIQTNVEILLDDLERSAAAGVVPAGRQGAGVSS